MLREAPRAPQRGDVAGERRLLFFGRVVDIHWRDTGRGCRLRQAGNRARAAEAGDQTMIEPLQTGSPKIVGFKLSGKLSHTEYRAHMPALEAALAAEGPLRIFVQFENDFHGVAPWTIWDDIRFAAKHYAGFERIALVGDGRWEAWLASFCRPFTQATVKHYKSAEVARAWAWLRADI